jgi:hypothetical protein
MTRHRKFQIAITTGVVVSTFLGYVAPELGHFAVIGTIATNLAWIWEA